MSATKTKGLGRGFDALLPTGFDSSLLVDETERIQIVLISKIFANPGQPRKHFDTQMLNELAQSIKTHGILQPLILSPKDAGYIIVAGERRFRAAQMAGLTSVPAIIRNRAEHQQLQVALIENMQRVDLSPIDMAISIEKLHQQFNESYTDIAKGLGKADTTISNIVRLLNLPAAARQALVQNQISEGHARSILAIKDDQPTQLKLLALIIKNNWSVRQAEQFVTAYKHGKKTTTAIKSRMVTETDDTKSLSKKLGVPVTIKRTARGGRIEIHFKDEAEISDIIKKLEIKN